MAYTWQWDDKIGTVVKEDGTKFQIYKGNGLAIFLWESETKYQVCLFFVDKQHLVNCEKDFEFWDGWKEVNFTKVYPDTWHLIKILVKHHIKVTIDNEIPIRGTNK